MHQLLENLVKLSVFIVCAQMLVHFRPGQAYEKYLKLIMNLLIVLQILLPLRLLLRGDGQQEIQAMTKEFLIRMENYMKDTAEVQLSGWKEKLQEVEEQEAEELLLQQAEEPEQTERKIQIEGMPERIEIHLGNDGGENEETGQ